MKSYIQGLLKNSLNKDVLSSVVLRGFNILFGLILLPLSLKLLSTKDYGIWLTIYALNTWVSLFDLGTQNTLRNKLATTIYQPGKLRLRGLLVTNSFLFSLALSFVFILLSTILYFFVDFTAILKISPTSNNNINALVFISLLSFALKLFTNNFNSILFALQKAYLTIFITTLSNLSTILLLLYLKFYQSSSVSIFSYGLIILSCDIIVSVLFPLIYLKSINFKYGVSLKNISLNFLKRQLLSSNVRFFIISILIVFTFFSDNFFIGILLTFKDVVAYNLVNRYFNVITMISVVALNPVWTQVSIYYFKNNITGINQLLKKMYLYFLAFIALAVVLLFFSGFFYHKFGNGEIEVPLHVSIIAALATLQLLFNNIHAYILNGMNKTTVQIYCLSFGALVIIPLYFTLVKIFHAGVAGSFIVQIIVFLPMSIFLPIYLRRYLKTETPDKLGDQAGIN